MVQPINYMTDVLSPIEGYLQGIKFGEGLNTERLNQDATRQNTIVQRQEMDRLLREEQRQVQAAQAQQAQVAQQQARAEAGAAALMQFANDVEAGTANPADLRNAIAQFPEMGDQFQSFWTGFNDERKANELQFGQQLSFALANDNIEAAERLLRTRRDAAEAAGDMQGVATHEAMLIELQQDPKGLLTQTLMPLSAVMPVEDFDRYFNDVLGLGGGEDVTAQSTIGKLQSDLRAGLISQEEYDIAVQNMAPSGMAIKTNPDGSVEFIQGAGVGGSSKPFTEGQGKDNVFATRARGALEVLEPVADALTSRAERAAEYVPFGLGRELQSDEFQVGMQSGDEFLQAILRKDTGAAITEPEQILYGRTYIPQPGDGPAVLEAKRVARIRAVNALEAGMSPEQMVARDMALIRTAREAEGGEPVDPSGTETPAPTSGTAGGGQPTRLRFNPETGEFE